MTTPCRNTQEPPARTEPLVREDGPVHGEQPALPALRLAGDDDDQNDIDQHICRGID